MSTIKTKNIKQTVISSVTQPLKIGGILEDGSDAKISIASDGTTTVNGSSQKLELLVNYTTTGSSITFSGLNIQQNESIQFEISVVNTGGNGNVILYLNGDTTSTNYWSQLYWINGTGGAGVLLNIPYLAESYGSGTKNSFILGTLINGTYPFTHTRFTLNKNDTMYSGFASMNKTASIGTITSLTFSGGFTSGTVIKIYRLS